MARHHDMMNASMKSSEPIIFDMMFQFTIPVSMIFFLLADFS
jgi:hypothetical protein